MSERRSCTSTARLASLAFVGMLVGMLTVPESAQARPAYKSAFEKLYPKFNKVTCAVCHPEKSKKERNHYGEALAKALKEKNVKDKKTIIEALKEIEDGHCPEPPKTKWKTLLEKGELPCTHDSKNSRLRLPASFIQRLLDRN